MNSGEKRSEERIRATVETLREAVRKAGYSITPDDRVGESDAALMLGYAPATLKTLRATFGSGPAWYRAPVGAHRISYRLSDLAAWLEQRREEGL